MQTLAAQIGWTLAEEAKEHHLEQALLDDIQKFRLELGGPRLLSRL